MTGAKSTTVGVFGVTLCLFVGRLPIIKHNHGPFNRMIVLAQKLFDALAIPMDLHGTTGQLIFFATASISSVAFGPSSVAKMYSSDPLA